MPTWREVIQDENYQKLPLGEKVKTKNEFFNRVISDSSKFKLLTKDRQSQIKTEFFMPKPEEGVEPFLPEKPSFGQIVKYGVEEFQQKSPFALLDKPVEEVAKFIEPEVPAGRTTAGLLIKDLPRQMVAETLRAYKPSTAAVFGLGMKALKPVAKKTIVPLAKKVWEKTPEPFKKTLLKEFTIGKGKPVAYQEIAKEAQLEKLAGGREAEQVAKTLTTKPKATLIDIKELEGVGTKLPVTHEAIERARDISKIAPIVLRKEVDGSLKMIDGSHRLSAMKAAGQKKIPVVFEGGTREVLTGEEQRYIGRIFRKEVIESPVLKAHPKYQELKAISDEGRAVMDKWSTELARSGIPKEQAKAVIEENIGQYMARMYRTKLKPETGMFGAIKNLRLRLGGLKHRKDLSVEVRNLMGEIKEPALPTAIRVKEISSSIANNKLFNKVVQNPEWVANSNVSGNLVKMADTPALGALKGKWVIPEIAEDINAIIKIGEQGQNLYLKGLSAWKYGKVVLNPATHARNMISNIILLDLSGTNHLRQAQLFPKAFNEYLSKGNFYKNAIEDRAIGGEFIGGEVAKLKDFYAGIQGNNLQKWFNIMKYPFKKAGDIYQAEEQIAKLVKYIDVLEKGGTRKLAAQEAQKWLFNYTEVPKFIDFTRKYAAPFITFTYKAIPRVGEALVNRPMAVYKYYALANAMNETSRKLQGMNPVEYARQKNALPDWLLKDIGGMPTNLLLPYRDKYNRTQWINLEYILPVGQAPEILEKGILKGGISNPLINLISDLSKNQDFRGKPIVPIGATKVEATKAYIEHIYRQLAPNLAPSLPFIDIKGGYSFEKVIDAIQQRPDFAERTRDLTPVLFDTLAGLKVTPLDVEEAETFKMINKKKIIEDLQIQALKLNHPAISEEVRTKKTEEIFQKIQRIIEK